MASVRESFLKGDMTFEGELPLYLVQEIDEVVRISKFISPGYKKQILDV